MSTKQRVRERYSAPKSFPPLDSMERWSWGLLVVFYLAGDIVTTIAGQELGAYEQTTVFVIAMDLYGYAGLIALKLFFALLLVGACYAATVFAKRLDPYVEYLTITARPSRLFLLALFWPRGITVTLSNIYYIWFYL